MRIDPLYYRQQKGCLRDSSAKKELDGNPNNCQEMCEEMVREDYEGA